MPNRTLTISVSQELFDWLQEVTAEFNSNSPTSKQATMEQLIVYMLDTACEMDRAQVKIFPAVGNA